MSTEALRDAIREYFGLERFAERDTEAIIAILEEHAPIYG